MYIYGGNIKVHVNKNALSKEISPKYADSMYLCVYPKSSRHSPDF